MFLKGMSEQTFIFLYLLPVCILQKRSLCQMSRGLGIFYRCTLKLLEAFMSAFLFEKIKELIKNRMFFKIILTLFLLEV